MVQSSLLTVLDDKNVRGIIAPPHVISRELLENLIDFIELSSAAVAKDTASRIREADRKKSWIPFQEVKKIAAKVR